MKLILASSGFNAPETVNKCIEFVGKSASEVSFAVINEAMAVEEGDHRWFLDDMDSIRNNFGGRITFVNLLALDLDEVKKRIDTADVIFIGGGSTDYLATILRNTGFDKILPEILERKVYVGSSAGSCVLGHRMPHNEEIFREKSYTDKYLELVDLAVFPHYHSPFFDRKDRGGVDDNREWAEKESALIGYPVYAISDNASIIVDDDETYVVGKDYLVAEKGKMKEEG